MAKTAEHATRDGPSPKDVGRHLRQVRRKQGLSRGEVARSAGLTRRELAAYERGRVPVPESDLWCLAGSCGVDVGDLLPERTPLTVSSDLSSLAVGDSIRRLRNADEPDGLLREYLSMLYELRNLPPGTRVPLREPDLQALADALGGSPEAIETRLTELIGASREEAARLRAMILPPPALGAGLAAVPDDPYAALRAGDDGEPMPDFFTTPRAADPFSPPPAPTGPPRGPVVLEPPQPLDALPVDPLDALRGDPIERSGFCTDTLYSEPLAPDPVAADVVTPEPPTALPADPFAVRPAPGEAWDSAPGVAWTSDGDTANDSIVVDDPLAGLDGAQPEPFDLNAAAMDAIVVDDPVAVAEPASYEEVLWREEPVPVVEAVTWQPEPEEPTGPPLVDDTAPLGPIAPTEPVMPAEAWVPAPRDSQEHADTDEFLPIAWVAHGEATPVPARADVPRFVQAGANWRIGGIFPATAMADDGALALRRADARWALADVDAPGDFTVEATFDFTAGAGFGVLFRSSVGEGERLNGYSFDVDPVAGGGGYLLRQWEDNRQHWRPLAQAPVADFARLYGRHTMTVTLRGDHLTVLVDGDTVLSIPALSHASIDLGRAPCRGDAVGVQAWATTEVTVDAFRVARY